MNATDDGAAKILFNREGEWRAIWRVLAFSLLFYLFLFLLLGLTRVPLPLDEDVHTQQMSRLFAAQLTIERSFALIAALLASALCAKKLERRSLSSIGLKLHQSWARDFALGSIIGALTLIFSIGIGVAFGAMRIQGQGKSIGDGLLNFAILFFAILIAAAFEEVLVRGFAFQAILHNGGAVAAVAITSGFFALLHVGNPGATALSTINTALAGVWLGVAYLKTRSLWLATALHYSWNLAMVFVFGLPVSGLNVLTRMALFDSTPLSPVWLSGGRYGPEGGLVTTVAVIASTLFIAKSGLFQPTQDMMAALRHGSPTSQTPRITPEEPRASG